MYRKYSNSRKKVSLTFSGGLWHRPWVTPYDNFFQNVCFSSSFKMVGRNDLVDLFCHRVFHNFLSRAKKYCIITFCLSSNQRHAIFYSLLSIIPQMNDDLTRLWISNFYKRMKSLYTYLCEKRTIIACVNSTIFSCSLKTFEQFWPWDICFQKQFINHKTNSILIVAGGQPYSTVHIVNIGICATASKKIVKTRK